MNYNIRRQIKISFYKRHYPNNLGGEPMPGNWMAQIKDKMPNTVLLHQAFSYAIETAYIHFQDYLVI